MTTIESALERLGPTLSDEEVKTRTERHRELKTSILFNVMEPEFRGSRFGMYFLLGVPFSIRLYFMFVSRGRYMMPTLFYSSMVGSLAFTGYAFTRDLDKFLKRKDDRIQNKILGLIVEENALTQRTPDYSDLVEERRARRG